MDRISIKALIDEGHVVICDTNVYLRIYDYSPEFAAFAIECLSSIKNSLLVTYTSHLEYKKHYMAKYAAAKTKIENYSKKLDELTASYKESIAKEFERINQYHFPDMDVLRASAEELIDRLTTLFDDYYDNHELLVAVNDEYLKMDPIKSFFDSISGQVLSAYSLEKIYEICDEGQKRFKKQQPPGFKDKNKDGIRQYSDLILWNEVIDYCIQHKKNIVFVTDDVKADWWEVVENDDGTTSKIFHNLLTAEFQRKTGQEIIALTSNDLFSLVSADYGVSISDAISMALTQTTDDYIDAISWKAFEKISDELAYSQNEYINDEGVCDIGSEGLSEFEIDDYTLIDHFLLERNDKEIIYRLKYKVTLLATSCDYWGRDDDTREAILSPPNEHVFEGTVELEVIRVVDDFVDLIHDNSFNEVSIVSGDFLQTSFKCGYEDDVADEAENYCPHCGNAMRFEEDAGNGFCIKCTQKYDL